MTHNPGRIEAENLPQGFEFADWKAGDVARFWDFVARAQPHLYFTRQNGARIVRHFRKDIDKAQAIVDFGSGPGFFIDHILAANKAIYGFDVSEQSLDSLRTRLSGAPGFRGAFGLDGLAEHQGYFDLAFCLEVVEHLDDATLKEALASVHGLLKPGGRLVISTPNEERLSDSFVCSPETGHIFHRWQHMRSWTADALTASVREAGFAVDECFACNITALGNSPRALAHRAAFWYLGRKPENLFCVATKN